MRCLLEHLRERALVLHVMMVCQVTLATTSCLLLCRKHKRLSSLHTHKVTVVVKPEALINSHCCFKENTLTFCLTVQTYRPDSADEAENTHWEAK